MDPYIGKLLDNRYELLELIGSGGMAKVYKARCHRLNRLVAVKILRDDLSKDSEFRRRFYAESQAVARLSHPNIVAVYDVSRSDDLEYIVMELIDGISLKQYMEKKSNKLNWREALHFITQIVNGLGHAHSRGIIHRDIKPHNIMVLRDGSVKVADFGIARLTSAGHSTLTQETLGSVHYISPEQARGSDIDGRSDLYSAGVVLYEMITGRLPFEGDSPVSVAIQHINSIPLSPRELNADIPEALESITMKAMASSAERRYANAAEMLSDLEEFRKNPDINFDYAPEEKKPVYTEAEIEKTQKVTITEKDLNAGKPVKTDKGIHAFWKKTDRDDGLDDEETRGEVWPIIVSIAAILLFVGGMLYFLIGLLRPMFQPTPDYSVPALVGQLYSEVVDDKDLLGDFTVVLAESVTSEEPEGTILKQSPDGDTTTKNPNAQISLTISSGPEIIVMPDVTGMEYHKALVKLQNMGLFVPVPSYAAHEEVPTNHVISYTPLEGAQMRPGDRVDLVVSTGPTEKLEQVPLFIGQTKEWALNKMELQNLKVGNIFEVWSEQIEAGIVVDQSIAAYTEVPQGTQINLQVSKGPDPSARPSTSNSKTVSVLLPADSGEIRVSLKDNGSVIAERTMNTAMDAVVTFQVTGTGVKKYDIFFDDQFHVSQTVDFNS